MKRFTLTTLAAALFAVAATAYAAPATKDTNNNVSVTPTEREKIEAVVHEYLLRKPEVLVEALQILQRKQYEQAEETVKQTQKTAGTYVKSLFHTPNDPVAGNPNGKITIVEFFDYQCPHCIDMVPVMDAIIKANPEVRVVYKEFPIRGPMSEVAARATLAANKQGKYNELSHAILASNQPLTQDLIMQLAAKVGLNVDQLKKDMSDKSIDTQIDSTVKLAKNLKLFGTPAFFIGKTDATASNSLIYVPGRMEQKQLQEEIDKASK
jgi:protein-disulfide isomerase